MQFFGGGEFPMIYPAHPTRGGQNVIVLGSAVKDEKTAAGQPDAQDGATTE